MLNSANNARTASGSGDEAQSPARQHASRRTENKREVALNGKLIELASVVLIIRAASVVVVVVVVVVIVVVVVVVVGSGVVVVSDVVGVEVEVDVLGVSVEVLVGNVEVLGARVEVRSVEVDDRMLVKTGVEAVSDVFTSATKLEVALATSFSGYTQCKNISDARFFAFDSFEYCCFYLVQC